MNKIIYFIFALLICSVSFADKNMKIGSKGKSSDVTRTIVVKMYDNYYEPNTFNIKKGETVKFEVKNLGELVHEFNIANPMMHIKHQPEMELMVENEILLNLLPLSSVIVNLGNKLSKIFCIFSISKLYALFVAI